MKMPEQKENPRASVAILCPYIFFAQAFKGILEHFPDAEIVPDYTSTPIGQQYIEEEKNRFRTWLNEQNLPWRDIDLSGITPGEFFGKYGTVVAPSYTGWVTHAALRQHKKVNVFYGSSKDLWGFSLANAHFDLICTPGPYFTNTLQNLYGRFDVEAVSTGEPKLDSLASLTKEEARTQLSIETVKPVLLIASTWGKLSSLSKIASALIGITDTYEVVLKAHHMTTLYDPEALDIFAGTPVRIIDQAVPITTAIRAADVVVSDGSSAIFDALLSNASLVIVDIIGDDSSFLAETAFYGAVDSKFTGVATRNESLEQIIKKPEWRIGPIFEAWGPSIQPQKLARTIEESIQNRKRYTQARKHFIETYFLPIDGNASLRVAEALSLITRSQSGEKKSTARNLFLALVDDFKTRENHEAHALYEKKLAGEIKNTERLEYLKALPLSKRFWAVFNEFFE